MNTLRHTSPPQASPDLVRLAATGTAISVLTVRVMDETGKLSMTYTMSNASIKSCQVGFGGSDRSSEAVTFHAEIVQPAPPT